jgi:formylglycine-generating enzyme required for sulfatase activity
VTQKEWEAIMNTNPCGVEEDNLPVTNVSWHDIQIFLEVLNTQTGKQYRLPTEAEWEFAARGGNQSKGFKYAGSDDVEEVAWCDANSNTGPCLVGQKKPNELDLYDMSGNVWEWCQDRYGEYTSSVQVNPKGPKTGKWRILRGGSWVFIPQYCRVALRNNFHPETRYNFLGFRLAHDFETF